MWRLALVLLVAACASPVTQPVFDPGTHGVVRLPDAGPPDAGPFDAGVPYWLTVFDDVRIQSPNGTGVRPDAGQNLHVAAASFSLTGTSFERVTLVVELATTCFPFESWSSNPPPMGHRWPADCDAFDRNFELELLSIDGGVDHELIRAITPFGGPLRIEEDVTHALNFGPTGRTLQVTIPTWSDGAGQVSGANGGWNVTARLYVVPGRPAQRVLAVVPLVDANDGPDAGRTVSFTVPTGATSARLEYRVTGHGGGPIDPACIGPAEEFCQRAHHLFIDGAKVRQLTPWRSDCASLCTVAHYGNPGFDYCVENPCGAMQSVRAPRANWCPGSVTEAIVLNEAALATPGPHSFGYVIDNVAPGGSWRVSAVLYVLGD
ncbi:MAG: hypothetical protein JNK82_11705 [Myxococcaceae bacterium]|nr:hypothetical protein [Myxococcaceae bacterium]